MGFVALRLGVGEGVKIKGQTKYFETANVIVDYGERRHAEHDGENHFFAGQVVRPESGQNRKVC